MHYKLEETYTSQILVQLVNRIYRVSAKDSGGPLHSSARSVP